MSNQNNPTAMLGAVSSTTGLSAAMVAAQAAKDRVAAQAAKAGQAQKESQQVPSPEQTAAIRTGEVATSSLAGLSTGKTYYHRIPGAQTVMPDGLQIVFAGGMFATDDPAIIHELDKVANKASSQIFTRRESLDAVRATENQVALDAGNTVGDNKGV